MILQLAAMVWTYPNKRRGSMKRWEEWDLRNRFGERENWHLKLTEQI